MKCSFVTWKKLSDCQKMMYITEALAKTVIVLLKDKDMLHTYFDTDMDNPFEMFPFSSCDFRSDLREIVNFYWKKIIDAKKSERIGIH